MRQLNEDLERQVLERAQARGVTWKLSPDLLGALNFKGILRNRKSSMGEGASGLIHSDDSQIVRSSSSSRHESRSCCERHTSRPPSA